MTRFGVSVVAAIALHVVVLALLMPNSLRLAGKPVFGNAIHARLLASTPVGQAKSRPSHIREAEAAHRSIDQLGTQAQGQGEREFPVGKAANESRSGSPASDFDTYLPRSVLSAGPSPVGIVDIPYPRFEGDTGRYRAEVTLFIDETGWVRRVDIETDALPPPLRAAVRQTFLATVFRPGEVSGVPVRSRLRLEVRFDTAPLPR